MISTECTIFTLPVIHLVHLPPPRPPSRKNRITLLGIIVVPREIQDKAKLIQNCGGKNKVHYGQCENSEFKTFGRFYALRCNLRSAKFLHHVRTHLAEPVHVRFTQYKNGVICTLWGYHLRALLAGVEV